jgi:hypothetical protein
MSRAIVTASVLLLCSVAGALPVPEGNGRAVAMASQARWTEVPWPFPMDQWGKGKAFACSAADCGTPVMVYIRAKIGFCNCSTGVADDDELDRIGDFDLFGNQASAQAPGHPITVAWMKGRSRPFTVTGTRGAKTSALSVGFNDRCDAIIATAVLDRGQASAIEPVVLDFLNSGTVLRWAEVTLGL